MKILANFATKETAKPFQPNMNNIAIYTITSPLHDKRATQAASEQFLGQLGINYDYCEGNFDSYGTHVLDLIYIRTGGAEGIFKSLLPRLREQSHQPIYLLTSGKSNSLAASMEILSYLRQQGIAGEILHGSNDYITSRIGVLEQVARARQALQGARLGIIGHPSDWLISSSYDAAAVKEKLGIELVEIPMQELLDEYERTPAVAADPLSEKAPSQAIKDAVPGAVRIYNALKAIVSRRGLMGFTIRCFDLLTSVHNTGCVALARLNAQGVVASCEGDVPAMLSMAIAQALTGQTGFQANPARIDVETGEMLFAHCTIPLNMVDSYELDTHFESGIGVGLRGYMQEGPVTLLKVSGSLDRSFVEEGTLVRNQAQPDLCRTQQVIQLACKQQARYFLTNPIGNHHIILKGSHKQALTQLLATIGC